MATISWLHLSDWHQRGPNFDRAVLRDALLTDIADRSTIDPRLQSIDFVVFSGDAAYNGKAEEYTEFRNHLLEPIRKALDLSSDRFFLVPGNHDLDRRTISRFLSYELQTPLSTDDAVQSWLTDAESREHLLRPFRAYEEFVTSYTGQPNPAYASIKHLDVADRSVALLGLNSAWMCGRNMSNDKVDDRGHLLIGEPQIHDALAAIADSDLRIVVMHHAFEWMAEFDRARVETRLKRAADIVLWGHEHRPQIRQENGTDGQCLIVPAGATFDRRIPSNPRYTNAYNFSVLDLEVGRGVIHLRRWNETQNKWVRDAETCDDGRFEFALPTSLVVTQEGSPSQATEARKRSAAEQRYRSLLLESCDIIDLANLPERDRNVAHRQLELRSLYVPLRVRIEAEAKTADLEGDEAWDALEQRRKATWAGLGEHDDEASDAKRVSVGERLTEALRLVVLGDPGAGKTTLTRWIATAYLLRLRADPDWMELPDVKTLPDANWLPILVRCRDLDKVGCTATLDDVLKHTLRKAELSEQDGSAVHCFLRSKIDSKEALLILDGLDEIADPVVRARFCEQIEQITKAHPALPVIATSRIVGYREMGRRLGRGFEHLTLAGFNSEEKDAFAHRWCALTEHPERYATAAAELIADIHSNDRIERLTSNPMLLTTMALVKRSVGKLPQRRADLYGEAVQVLLKWRSEIDEAIDYREALPQLEYLAYSMCDKGAQNLREDEVIRLFKQMREDYPNVHPARNHTPEDFLCLLERRTGILIEAGRTRYGGRQVPVYEFRHLSFQEYLAAQALVNGRYPGHDSAQSLALSIAPLAGRIEESSSYQDFEEVSPEFSVIESWREPLRLCVAICPDKEVDAVLGAILHCLPGEPAEAARARAIQAAQCLSDEPNVSDHVGAEIVHALTSHVSVIDDSFTHGSSLAEATISLASTRWAPVLQDALAQEFFSRGAETRGDAGGLLGEFGRSRTPDDDAALSEWLRKCIDQLETGSEREAAAQALTVMELAYERRLTVPSELIVALADRLSGSAPMAHAAAWALGWIAWNYSVAAPGAATRIMSVISNPQADHEAARWSIIALTKLKTAIPVKHLSFWAEQFLNDHARRVTLDALELNGSSEAFKIVETFINDSSMQTRRIAFGVLIKQAFSESNTVINLAGHEITHIDPREEIDTDKVRLVSEKLKKPQLEVHNRLEALAKRLNLSFTAKTPM
ncbi:metallophosphoesterase [Azospirillum sp.]|uniref:metallophosphoesterase n=1 Tax=Azospirillum sp. TaxID=34012 RepID=UPI003D761055